MTDTTRAYDAGHERGVAAGFWVVSEDNASEVLALLADCELDIPHLLSGAWLGESIPELSRDYDLDLADEWIADSFESGYYDGYCERVEKDALAYLGPEGDRP